MSFSHHLFQSSRIFVKPYDPTNIQRDLQTQTAFYFISISIYVKELFTKGVAILIKFGTKISPQTWVMTQMSYLKVKINHQ